MQINIKGKNIRISPNLRNFVNKKVQKLINDLEHPIDCQVILEQEKNRIFTEIIMHGDHGRFYYKKFAKDPYSSIEATMHTADSAIKRFKDKQKDRNQKEIREKRHRGFHRPYHPDRYRIRVLDKDVKGLKPMSLEEAFLQLKYLRKSFIIFSNAKTERINLIFRDRNQTFLLKPPPKWKFFMMSKIRMEKFSIEYKINRTRLKRKVMDIQDMNDYKVFEKLRSHYRYVIYKNDNQMFIIYWESKNTVGRYKIA
ncbi:MAG: ribosome-associated translation inhibitor RaiA [Spirochaetes bacterium]|nr:ribosome-associated translation inhibitor RaiA [Spirochaetota bacterium]